MVKKLLLSVTLSNANYQARQIIAKGNRQIGFHYLIWLLTTEEYQEHFKAL
jgi:hypothetical protein